jgi:hypothetical protein
MVTPQHPISNRFIKRVWLDGACFFPPCRGINDGRLGDGGGDGDSSPRRDATVGERNVADVIEGLSCE